ncbi:MAG: DgaE family pyridoxal phosphate-dependent ammonia lyase [Clostridium sp.]
MDNIYTKYGVKKVINASGKMTILGGSRVEKRILSAMNEGAGNFFEVKDLLDKTGEYISNLLNVESAYIVSSASSGIAQCIASTIAKDDLYNILNINSEKNKRREVIIPKGHNVDYGTPVEVPLSLGGGVIKEAGYANTCTYDHVESLINENTAALLYIKSHHCVQKGIISIEDYIKIGKKYSIPVIIDAAAEEDLVKYYNLGADGVIYSGTKALEGPTSGIVIGKKNFITRLKLQSKGIGRVMKVGKENILGLTEAIEKYINRNKLTMEDQASRLEQFNLNLAGINGIEARCVRDSAGREIIRSEITFNEDILKKNAIQISQKLKLGEVRIYTRDYRANEGKIEIDIRDVNNEELNTIYTKIKKIIEE